MPFYQLLFAYRISGIKFLITVSLSLITVSGQAQIFDSYSFEAGKGNDASLFKLAAQKPVLQDNAFVKKYHLHPYIEFSVSALHQKRYQNIPGPSKTIADVGITPVLRWQPNANGGIFGEIGVGVHYMSDYYNNDRKVASTRFQFGDLFGIGYKFSNSLEVTLKLLHFSNGRIKQPNPAINFTTIKVGYSF